MTQIHFRRAYQYSLVSLGIIDEQRSTYTLEYLRLSFSIPSEYLPDFGRLSMCLGDRSPSSEWRSSTNLRRRLVSNWVVFRCDWIFTGYHSVRILHFVLIFLLTFFVVINMWKPPRLRCFNQVRSDLFFYLLSIIVGTGMYRFYKLCEGHSLRL